jgi:hypothetical protein
VVAYSEGGVVEVFGGGGWLGLLGGGEKIVWYVELVRCVGFGAVEACSSVLGWAFWGRVGGSCDGSILFVIFWSWFILVLAF